MTQWINERMNKDNFWNLMFWVGINIGLVIGLIVNEPKFLWVSTIVSIFFAKKMLRVTFDKEQFFLNSRGEQLFDRCPNLLLTILGSFGVLALFAHLEEMIFEQINESLSIYLTISVFTLAFISFFIYKNCPISILFNINFWKPNLEFEVQKNADGSTSIIKKRNPLHPSWNIKIRNPNSSNLDI